VRRWDARGGSEGRRRRNSASDTVAETAAGNRSHSAIPTRFFDRGLPRLPLNPLFGLDVLLSPMLQLPNKRLNGTSVQCAIRSPSTERGMVACGGVPGPQLCQNDLPGPNLAAHNCRPGSLGLHLEVSSSSSEGGRRSREQRGPNSPINPRRPRCSCDAGPQRADQKAGAERTGIHEKRVAPVEGATRHESTSIQPATRYMTSSTSCPHETWGRRCPSLHLQQTTPA